MTLLLNIDIYLLLGKQSINKLVSRVPFKEIHIFTDAPMEKTNCPFPSRYQLQISFD